MAEIANLLPPAPSARTTLAFTLFTLPLTSYQSVLFNIAWFFKFTILRSAYGPAEHALLTSLAADISEFEWERMAEADKAELLCLELWVKANLKAFREEEEAAAQTSSTSARRTAKEKRNLRMKKKGIIVSMPMDLICSRTQRRPIYSTQSGIAEGILQAHLASAVSHA